MFLPPKQNIDKWRQLLPNKKRIFKENDRVCELHFEEGKKYFSPLLVYKVKLVLHHIFNIT
jgi:hypothetical protein